MYIGQSLLLLDPFSLNLSNQRILANFRLRLTELCSDEGGLFNWYECEDMTTEALPFPN